MSKQPEPSSVPSAAAVACSALVSRWSEKQQERAHSIVNDIAEDIDNGESRKQLRQALAIYADLYFDATQNLKLKELGEASELCKRLEAAIAANAKVSDHADSERGA